MKRGLAQKLNRGVGSALHDWSMIKDQDRILVGVSGGKDSLVLLHVLSLFRGKAPISFELVPVHVDPGFNSGFTADLKWYVDQHYAPLLVDETDHGLVAHSTANRENPCFLCSRLRRKRLFEMARELGCQKIALGHNKDDLIETLFINMFYSGKIGTMKPRQSFFQGKLDIIRPLSYVEAHEIERFSKKMDMPIFDNPCPSAGKTRREDVRKMLEGMYRQNNHIKGNIFRAMGNVAMDYLL